MRSSIPAFLRSLATLLRQLIAAGRAVHCTEADAAELELLAGLFEHAGPVKYRAQSLTIPAGALRIGEPFRIDAKLGECEVTPADIALGWLRASKCHTYFEGGETYQYDHVTDADMVQRAAVCAELAFMSMILLPRLGEIRNDDLPAGCPEGARAAWAFVVERLEFDYHQAVEARAHPRVVAQTKEQYDLADKYRRELEAMK